MGKNLSDTWSQNDYGLVKDSFGQNVVTWSGKRWNQMERGRRAWMKLDRIKALCHNILSRPHTGTYKSSSRLQQLWSNLIWVNHAIFLHRLMRRFSFRRLLNNVGLMGKWAMSPIVIMLEFFRNWPNGQSWKRNVSSRGASVDNF